MNDISTSTSAVEGHKRIIPTPIRKRALKIIKGTATFADRYVPDHGDLVELVDDLRSMGCMTAFVTGNWDLFHRGHVKYIRRGKEEAVKLYPDADHLIMIVGVDSDELTVKRKGPGRPIVPLIERAEILTEQRVVDVVVPQYEADQLYRLVKHDVRIISLSTKDLPDLTEIKKYCEHVVNLPPQAETSTTARIRRLAIDGSYKELSEIADQLAPIIEALRLKIDKLRSEEEGEKA